jgi:hypothetical protein
MFSFHQNQDLRSLAVFRILLGIYIVYDVFSRLCHGYLSLMWFSSPTTTTTSFLHPDDTPHGNPVHRIWFFRGSVSLQIILFPLTALFAVLFAIGWKCNTMSKVILWTLVVSMQHRNMHMHDGSDTYTRHLLLWSCQLPLAQVWSLDSYLSLQESLAKGKKRDTQEVSIASLQYHSAAVWGLRLQVLFMYFGTVLNRTLDLYGWHGSFRSAWMPPKLSAVHYALSASFASRPGWLGDLIRHNVSFSQFMTLSAMIIETLSPILCLILNDGYVLIPALLLFKLHLGLLIMMNLPNWQFVGMLATTIWIPSSSWDKFHQSRIYYYIRNLCFQLFAAVTFIPAFKLVSNTNMYQSPPQLREKGRWLRFIQSSLTLFFLIYMIYNFCGEHRWIPKHDHGDIGEFLRFSQHWVMYGSPPKTSVHTIIIGKLKEDDLTYDVWEWIRSGRIQVTRSLPVLQNDLNSSSMTYIYPSPRWERIFHQWGEKRDKRRAHYFLKSLCRVSPFQDLTLKWDHLIVMPPNSPSRFQYDEVRNTVIHEVC